MDFLGQLVNLPMLKKLMKLINYQNIKLNTKIEVAV